MKNKFVLVLSALLALSVGAAGAAACNDEQDHKHNLQDVPFYDATCTHQGRLAHQECTDCHKYFINGKEVGESELVIPKDSTKHILKEVEYIAATCVEGGMAAHSECQECGNYYINGEYVSKSSVELEIDPNAHKIEHQAELAATCGSEGLRERDECVLCHKIYKNGAEEDISEYRIPKAGAHAFADGALECSICDAYKLLSGGEYYIIDSNNLKTFVTGSAGTSYDSKGKNEALADHLANPMTFGSQCNSGISAANSNGNEWVLTNTKMSDVSSFTRFLVGKPGETTGYVGRFIITFDVTASANTAISRFGLNVVDNTATTMSDAVQSKLFGTNDAADQSVTSFNAGTTYRFAYDVETTAENQLMQIFGCFTGESSVSVSNLHIVFIDGGTTGTVTTRLLYMGETEGVKISASECEHNNAYAVAGTATCAAQGTLDHDHCPQCGKDLIGGTVTEDITGKLDHNLGEWVNDESGHWKECSECHGRFETAAHSPGPEATAETPQVCTVCDYIIAAATTHQHEMNHKAAKPETCTENGNIEYWYCTGCEKYFSDENGDNEILSDSITISAHHILTNYTAGEATCYKRGTDVDYSQCSVCGKYFADGEEIAADALFTKPLKDHSFNESGACTNEGCTATKAAAAIDVPEACFGNLGAVINPALVENPGKWAAQTTGSSTASVESGVLKIGISSNKTKDKNKSFVRVIPSQNGTEAFVGTYIWTFDFKVTAGSGSAQTATEASLIVGFGIQSTTITSNIVSITDAETKFEIGKTYRFSVLVETVDATQFAQFNIRNVANGGADVEISNASYVFYPETANTGTNILSSLAFAELIEETAPAVTANADAAIAEDKRYLAA